LITSREAMLAVPDEYRDASAALGVSKWQTIRSVVIPAAMPGVVTGVILGVGRIAGETAPLLLVMGGGSFVPAGQRAKVLESFQFSASPPFVTNPELLQATTALPYQLYQVILTGTGQTAGVNDVTQFGWGTALVLLAVVLSFYAIGIATRQYFRRKLKYE
jgi:phosphate transport system permease protein